jgi:hypothetical protein
MFVEVGLDVVGWDAEVLVEEAEEISLCLGLSCFGVILQGEEFDAVAGGEDETFADAWLMEEGAGGVGESGRGDREALANLDGRGVVVDTEEDEASLCRRGLRVGFELVHGVVNLWTAEN